MKGEIVAVRFDLNVAERQRQGKDTPESTTTLEIDLTQLEQKDRVLLANRMERGEDNIFDVCRLQWDGAKEFRRPTLQEGRANFYAIQLPVRIQVICLARVRSSKLPPTNSDNFAPCRRETRVIQPVVC